MTPAVVDFLAVGGRVMVNPRGELEFAGGGRWMHADTPEPEANRLFQIERRLAEAIRSPQSAARIADDVRQQGAPVNGWAVLEREAA